MVKRDVEKGNAFCHLGAPLGVNVSNKQKVGWVLENIEKKMKIWEYTLLPFHSVMKVVNTIMILYVSFFLTILKISKCNWEEFLKLIKTLL